MLARKQQDDQKADNLIVGQPALVAVRTKVDECLQKIGGRSLSATAATEQRREDSTHVRASRIAHGMRTCQSPREDDGQRSQATVQLLVDCPDLVSECVANVRSHQRRTCSGDDEIRKQ